MPFAAPRCCPKPGHPPFTEQRCPACVQERGRAYDATRPSAPKRGYDRDWYAFRDDYLRRYPTCCERGCGQPATEAHHVVPLRAGGLRFDPSNIEPLCKAHHSQRTAREQGFARGGDRGSTTRPRGLKTARGVSRETSPDLVLPGNRELP
jgi:5-methylcytosine-specific restriction protein A